MRARRSLAAEMWAVCLCLLAAVAPARALDVAVPYVQAGYLWAQGYSGSGLEIGVIDLYLADSNHPAINGNYRGYVKFSKGVAYISSHATEVTGAAVSQNATYKGVAPGAGWWTGQTTSPAGTTTVRTQTIAAETFGQGLDDLNGNPVEVITLSIGMDGNTAGTDQWSLALDHIVNTNGRTVTVAAGNDGPGIGTLNGLPTGAYNVITVGATGDTNGNPSQDYSVLADFSSRGPTSDGRCKPDIVAPGSVIHLPTLNNGWADGDGTSFATPLVAGGAALLIDMGQDLGYSTDPKVIKSVLLNSADKLDGWNQTPTRPLDYGQGAGQMNLRSAGRQYQFAEKDPGVVSGIGWDRQTLAHNEEKLYTMDVDLPAGAMVTATLTWDRIVATDREDVKKVIYSLDHLDDLNLQLYRQDDPLRAVAASVSTVDNVEHVYYTVPQAGRYLIGVEMSGAGAGDSETYGLAWRVTPAAELALPGDANLNGKVNVGDLGILGAHYGQGDKTWFECDFNGDGYVDVGDLGLLGANYGSGAGGAAIPEPAGLLLFGAAVPMLLKRKSGRRPFAGERSARSSRRYRRSSRSAAADG